MDTSEGQKELKWFTRDCLQAAWIAEEVEKQGRQKISKVIHFARLGWGLIQGIVRAAGGSISMTTRLVVSAAFGAIQTLYPILSAALHGGIASMNVAAITASLLGLGELTSAILALIAYQNEQRDLAFQMRGLTFATQNIELMLSSVF